MSVPHTKQPPTDDEGLGALQLRGDRLWQCVSADHDPDAPVPMGLCWKVVIPDVRTVLVALERLTTEHRKLQEENDECLRMLDHISPSLSDVSRPNMMSVAEKISMAEHDILLMVQRDDEGSDKCAALEAKLVEAEATLNEAHAVCACGCPNAAHENYGEDGEACENEDHQCVRTNRAVLTILTAERAAKEQLTAERDMLRGVGCLEDGDGPCGVCVKCLRVAKEQAEQERDEAVADKTRAILRATVKAYIAGENTDGKAWRERAEAAEAEVINLRALDTIYAKWSLFLARAEAAEQDATTLREALARQTERACRFNTNAESLTCRCAAHEFFRIATRERP